MLLLFYLIFTQPSVPVNLPPLLLLLRFMFINIHDKSELPAGQAEESKEKGYRFLMTQKSASSLSDTNDILTMYSHFAGYTWSLAPSVTR